MSGGIDLVRAYMLAGKSFWAAHFLTYGHVWPLEAERQMIAALLDDAGLTEGFEERVYTPAEPAPIARPAATAETEGNHGGATLAEVAQELRLSRERVRHIERRALRKLRVALERETFARPLQRPECTGKAAYI